METLTSFQKILVTGANGQLGKELQEIAAGYPSYQFLFATRDDLPIDNFGLVEAYFQSQGISYCINCAAYTAVDKAEQESEKAFLINAAAVANLARVCKDHGTRFIHISTDYVFNGKAATPYSEQDNTDPLNVYGASKLKGEQLAFANDPASLVIRTSWVYSRFGNNFVKTMLRLLHEKENINVVNDQFGCPTYAADLAQVIMKIIEHPSDWIPGIFHYCNKGVTSWYDFALAIQEHIKSTCVVNPIRSAEYKTLAPRPHFSVLDTQKICTSFSIEIPAWKQSLQDCLLTLP